MRSWRTSWRMTPCSSRASQLLARRTITSLVSDLSHPPEYVLPVVKPTAGLRTPQLATSIPSSAAVAAALADKDSDTPRTSFEQLALVESLQQEICKHGELVPAPSDSNDWPPTLLRRYFESGGLLTLEALNEQPDSAETRFFHCPSWKSAEASSGRCVQRMARDAMPWRRCARGFCATTASHAASGRLMPCTRLFATRGRSLHLICGQVRSDPRPMASTYRADRPLARCEVISI